MASGSGTLPKRTEQFLRRVLVPAGLVATGFGPVIAAFIAITSPSYFGPMLTSLLGLGMLTVAMILAGGGVAVVLIAKGWLTKGGWWFASGALTILAAISLQFVTFWIILIGPAFLILLNSGAR